MRFVRASAFAVLLTAAPAAFAGVFGAVRGVVHDPQHHPVPDAMVMLKAQSSDWSATANSDVNGNFSFNAVPVGQYVVSVAALGFEQMQQDVVVMSGTQPVLHFSLRVAGTKETVNVSASLESAPTDSSTPTTLVSRLDVARTPGADRSNSVALITNFVPGAYLQHDHLHVRGGHQTSWLIDGVPVPNTNIASNVAPQLDPKDVDYLEVSRGSYGAELGDRTYGVFNVVPRTGFERNREAEIVFSAGNFYQTNDQLSMGSHTQRLAYYASVNGNRSNLGLQPPVAQVVHDAANGYGGFGSVIFNADPSNQLRFVTSLRRDFYEIPYDPFPGDLENGTFVNNEWNGQYPSIGLRDAQHEADALTNFSWVHTFNSKTLVTVSPFYHYNRANYDSLPSDYPSASTDHRSSAYAGGQLSFSTNVAKNDLQAGAYGFYQQNDELFAVVFTNNSLPPLQDHQQPTGSLVAFFLDDKLKPFSWLTLSAGLRPTHFSGVEAENSISPRFGATLTLPRLNWTFRAFYGHYYQAPPLLTISGPLEQFCQTTNCGFAALHGERDEEHQFGVSIPYRGWTLDADNFVTRGNNFFDHNCIGSGTCFPVTDQRALISGWEVTLRSTRIAHRGELHLAYSNQVALAGGAVTGGLTNFISNICSPPFAPTTNLCPLDHDQRNTLNVGGDVALPRRSYASTNVYYGSGFSNAFPGQPYPGYHLPAHTTFDLALGKEFGERFAASLNLLNVANRRIELDNSQTFGGFHWNNPRETYVELRYRFHY